MGAFFGRSRAGPPVSRRSYLTAGRRIYAIGDIHGRVDLFARLIDEIGRDNAGRRHADVAIVVLGDFIDRGPDSSRMIALMRACAEWPEQFIVLRGNHEQMMLDSLNGDWSALNAWLVNGGDATLTSFGMPAQALHCEDPEEMMRNIRSIVPTGICEWLASLPYFYQQGDYLFVHAGIKPRISLDKQLPRDLLWIRRPFLNSGADHGFTVVHGHSTTDKVELRRNRIGIDTGAYHTGRLTALGVEDDQQWMLEFDGGSER